MVERGANAHIHICLIIAKHKHPYARYHNGGGVCEFAIPGDHLRPDHSIRGGGAQ